MPTFDRANANAHDREGLDADALFGDLHLVSIPPAALDGLDSTELSGVRRVHGLGAPPREPAAPGLQPAFEPPPSPIERLGEPRVLAVLAAVAGFTSAVAVALLVLL